MSFRVARTDLAVPAVDEKFASLVARYLASCVDRFTLRVMN
jgi:hypothetical protein